MAWSSRLAGNEQPGASPGLARARRARQAAGGGRLAHKPAVVSGLHPTPFVFPSSLVAVRLELGS